MAPSLTPTDLFGRPLQSPLTGGQGEFPFPGESSLDAELRLQAEAWRQSRCRQTRDLFASNQPTPATKESR